ncbi:ubiquitin carboxyl-terminal hydrolase Usp2-like [Phlebotomus argentipes]|uniref:ubiquitin carboxyl-terminal hydrolase Usp2-like n=1 Tax=Phlebotomus argentipes TaxID=94469 RepID=UPI00289323E7|nr:ubiquitin carboxyl-terminal hydrolase Usp2-like [Phlebotomus argentipes]XP_059619056.1 ubiquitin carboxyl-terminal hydrolase Usp2-like [Phlebotomus argentipes]
MPMISTRSSGTSCLPPSVGSYSSTLSASKSRLSGSSGYSSSLGDSYLSRYRSPLTSVSSSSTTSLYHRTNDSPSRSSILSSNARFGVSSKTRASCDRDPSSSTSSSGGRLRSTDSRTRDSESSLARSLATSGADLYEKYSPAYYIPKCELSRSRSLSEASKFTPTSAKNGHETPATEVDGVEAHGALSGGQQAQGAPGGASTVSKVRVSVSPNHQHPTNSPNAATCNNNTEMLSTTNTTKSTTPDTFAGPASGKRQRIIFGSTYRDQNFLKPECDLARSQVVRSSDPEANNNEMPTLLVTGNRLATRADTQKPLVHTKFRGRLQITENGNKSELEEIRNTILKAYKPLNPEEEVSKSPSDSSDDIKFIDSDESEYQKITQKIATLSSGNATLPFAGRRTDHSPAATYSTLSTRGGFRKASDEQDKGARSASSEPPNDKITGNVLEVNGSIRSTSLRSALPPVSPVRSWDRSRYRDIYDSDYKSSSTLSTSSILKDTYDKLTTDSGEGLCGLRNIGNTCFMNSVIQCLSHTNDLTTFLKGQRDPKSVTKDQRIFSEFVKLIKEMWSSGTRSVTPSDLKSAFSSKHRMYSGCAQQDAQEFLRFFLDSLHSALNEGTKTEGLQLADNLNDSRKADLMWEWYSKTEKSMVKDLFVGQLKSTLKCTVCGNTSVTFDPFWDLSLPLPASSTRSKLENCLELFIREEILDGDEMPTCSKCQTRRKSTKSFTIQRFPKYLVIHLKRFSETRWSKLTNIIEFPTGEKELNLTPYASTSNYSSTLYSLYAISNHMGSTGGGHYVALCKHPQTGKWHEFDDNTVRDATESSLISSSAYLLFYERV